jgi:hypothetical protein
VPLVAGDALAARVGYAVALAPPARSRAVSVSTASSAASVAWRMATRSSPAAWSVCAVCTVPAAARITVGVAAASAVTADWT